MTPSPTVPSVLPSSASSLSSASPVLPADKLLSAGPMKLPTQRRRFGDVDATRNLIYDNILKAAQSIAPVRNTRFELAFKDIGWEGPPNVPLSKQKETLLSGRTLSRKLRGTAAITDLATGKVLEEKPLTLLNVPIMSQRGTFIVQGTELGLMNQLRLRPGIYTRRKSNNELEAHLNIMPGQGLTHRMFLDPETGVFKLSVGQANVPLLPLLRAMGATDQELRKSWGDGLVAMNLKHDSPHHLEKLFSKFVRKSNVETPPESRSSALVQAITSMPVDPDVTRRTLGTPFDRLSKDVYLTTARKLVAINRGEAEPDDRDHLAYQTIMGPEDLLAERIGKDRKTLSDILWKATLAGGSLKKIGPGVFDKSLMAAFITSGLGVTPEGVNAAEFLDHLGKVTRLGEGGISKSSEAIPMESRNVSASQFLAIDPILTPESEAAGVTLRMAFGTQKGTDGRVYMPLRDPRSNKIVYRSPQELQDLTVAFPGELRRNKPIVAALQDGKIRYVARGKVDLEAPSMEQAFSPLSNMVPLKSGSKPQRASMGARMISQALSLLQGEAPLVRSAVPGQPNKSFEEIYGKHMGAIFADQPGRVEKVTPDEITVRYEDGSRKTHELYNLWPGPRKSGLYSTPVVSVGDRVQPEQLLARSNYTNDRGEAALGVNARIAYMPDYAGGVYEDAIVISESLAKKLTSEHFYQHPVEWNDDGFRKGLKAYVALFPGKYTRKFLEKYDDDGVIKVGSTVNSDEPLVLLAKERERTHSQITRSGKAAFSDASQIWDHHNPGIVTDVVPTKAGVNVIVRSLAELQQADKVSGRFGSKSVTSRIVPDDEMPTDEKGQPFEAVWSPLAAISRTNPSWVVEGALGKVAQRTGKPYKITDFDNMDSLTRFAIGELQKNGLSDTETVVDPRTGRKILNVFTGVNFLMKLHHMSESKAQGRGLGAYDALGSPLRGQAGGAQRLSLGDTNAIIAHGANAVLQDARAHRGQKDDAFWMAFMGGYPTPHGNVPPAFTKFLTDLKAAGINVVRDGPRFQIMALTDRDIDKLAGDRELKNTDTVHFDKGLEPVKGGLFDPAITGGHGSQQWSKIKLVEPMPNPVFQDPIRYLLGLTEEKFMDTIAGRHEISTGTGPDAIKKALKAIDIDKEIKEAREIIATGKKSMLDDAVRRLGYLKSLKRTGLEPADWMLNSVPVLPSAFRPVSIMAGNKGQLIADPNILYREVWDANENLRTLKGQIDDVGDERLTLYNAFKGVVGLGEPTHPKNVEKGVKGIIKSMLGSTSKYSWMQQKLLGTSVDLVGRGAVVPNANLDMDSVGIPENQAWQVYHPFVVRRLVRRGMPRLQALESAQNRDETAKAALLEEIGVRPVLLNRYPILHRYNQMAFWPKLVKGDAIQVSPLITKGYTMDFDGDTSAFHVPVSDRAVKDAVDKMLPSKNLYSAASFSKPMYLPNMEFQQGLHVASSSRLDSARPKVFATRKDALLAAIRDHLDLGQPVEIVSDD